MSEDDRGARTRAAWLTNLTPAMRWALGGVALVVVAGLVVSGLLIGAPDVLPFGPSAGRGSEAAGQGGSASASATPTQGPLPGATPTTGSEVLPPAEDGGTTTDPNRLPDRTPAVPLVAAPLPASADAQGELVAGYPTAVMPPTEGSDVVSSSIASDGTTMQVSLVARTDASADEVSAYYQQLWSGLALAGGAAGDGTPGLAYADSFTSVSLGFSTAQGTGTLYNVYGVFRTG